MNIYLMIGLICVVSFSLTLFWAWSLCIAAAKSDRDVELWTNDSYSSFS